MNKTLIIALIILCSIRFSFSQIPIENYRKDIEALETEQDIQHYWLQLYDIDQKVLLKTTDLKETDSISVSNMIKTYLLLEIHKTKGYNPNGYSGFLPILNLSHNRIGQSQIAYWPIIEKCAEIGGAIENFGGAYPAYELESIALTFYNYSLFNQAEQYPKLLAKLHAIQTKNVIEELVNSFKYQNELRALKEVSVLNQWQLQALKNQQEEGQFAIVKMSDGNLYLKRHNRLQKLERVETNGQSIRYRIENEPFGWSYKYGLDGSLSLIDDEDNELIRYTLIK